ncbi:hypothetical protein ACWDG1_49635 [Streptomyces sp. NPDC001177]
MMHTLCPDRRIDAAAEQDLLRGHDRAASSRSTDSLFPALLKQRMDEVPTIGFAYGPGGEAPQGKMLQAVVSTRMLAGDYAQARPTRLPAGRPAQSA